MSICIQPHCPASATGRVAHSWRKRYPFADTTRTLFMTEPLCDVHQVKLCEDMRVDGVPAFAVPLDYEQRMEQARRMRAEAEG